MSIYSASSIAAVSVSPEGHGGCGQTHRRPVSHGAPAKIWELDCPPCENHLRSDPMWATTLADIPETYDEQKAREDFDKRGARDRDQVLALALAKLAGVELPETLIRPLTGRLPDAVLPGTLVCPSGHENPAGQKFCGECAAPLSAAVPAAAIPAAPPPAPVAPAVQNGAAKPPAASQGGSPALEDLHVRTLVGMANRKGLDSTGSKPELIARLREHDQAVTAA